VLSWPPHASQTSNQGHERSLKHNLRPLGGHSNPNGGEPQPPNVIGDVQ